jgi:hypothetical protein
VTRRALPFALLASLIAALASAEMPPFELDLASLVILSDTIVSAERVSKREDPKLGTLTKVRCTKAYSGWRTPGEEFEVRGALEETFLSGNAEDRIPLDREVILFLLPVDRTRFADPDYAAFPWIPSTYVRYLCLGKVYLSLDQPLFPSHEPHVRQVRGRRVGTSAATLAEFEQDLGDAIARVAAFRAALDSPDEALRRDRVVALFDPPPADPVVLVWLSRDSHFHPQPFGSRVAEALL